MLTHKTLLAALLTVGLALGGCSTEPPAPSQSLYQRLGGKPAITAVVDDFIGNVANDSHINRRFAHTDVGRLKRNLVDQICVITGGPCTYTGRNMADVHDGMNITDAEFDSLVADLTKTLDKFKVPAREKSEVLTLLGRMRNVIVGH